jgi:ankyrin repeat protein
MKIAKVETDCPNTYLFSLSKAAVFRSYDLEHFFHTYSDGEKEAYGMEVTTAVRSLDVEKMHELLEQGQTFQCSNRFGESLIHIACRRGSFEVVKFLIEEAKVTVAVQDDFGRTPLHDAFWTALPNPEVVDLLIKECPSLLFISDVRGFTPLQYARTEHNLSWKTFLIERESSILKGLDDLRNAIKM